MKSIYISIFFLLIIFNIQAQLNESDSVKLSRELTLEKEYDPSVKDAVKINELPKIKEPEAPKAVIEFSNFTVPYEVKPEIPLLKPGSYFTDLSRSGKRGYLDLGVSTFVDIDGDLGYQLIDSDKDRLSIWGSHRSSNGKVKFLQDGEKQKMKINDNKFGISYDHKFDNLKFFIDGNYTYSAFNYYGYNDSLALQNDSINKDKNQVNNIFDATVGIVSDPKGDELNYLFKLNYSYFGQKYTMNMDYSGPKENYIRFDMDLNKPFDSDKLIGLSGSVRSTSYSIKNKDFFFDYENYADIGLNPYFEYDGGLWNVHLGVLVDILINHEDNFNLAPDIAFQFRPKDNLLFYLNAKGGVTDNSNKNIFEENRYSSPLYRVRDSYSSFDGDLGMKAAFGNFWFNIFTGYKYIRDEHFYTSNTSPYLSFYTLKPYLGNNFLLPEYRDAGVFKLGGELKYEFSDMFEVGLKAEYNNWRTKKEEDLDGGSYGSRMPAWNKPEFITDLNIGFKVPQFPLRFDLDYHMETGRESRQTIYQYDGGGSIKTKVFVEDMKNINLLNLQGSYTINEYVSIYARLNNLLFQEYDLWYGYTAQGFNVMAGVNFKF